MCNSALSAVTAVLLQIAVRWTPDTAIGSLPCRHTHCFCASAIPHVTWPLWYHLPATMSFHILIFYFVTALDRRFFTEQLLGGAGRRRCAIRSPLLYTAECRRCIYRWLCQLIGGLQHVDSTPAPNLHRRAAQCFGISVVNLTITWQTKPPHPSHLAHWELQL